LNSCPEVKKLPKKKKLEVCKSKSWNPYEPIFLEDEEEEIKDEPLYKDDMGTQNLVSNLHNM